MGIIERPTVRAGRREAATRATSAARVSSSWVGVVTVHEATMTTTSATDLMRASSLWTTEAPGW